MANTVYCNSLLLRPHPCHPCICLGHTPTAVKCGERCWISGNVESKIICNKKYNRTLHSSSASTSKNLPFVPWQHYLNLRLPTILPIGKTDLRVLPFPGLLLVGIDWVKCKARAALAFARNADLDPCRCVVYDNDFWLTCYIFFQE